MCVYTHFSFCLPNFLILFVHLMLGVRPIQMIYYFDFGWQFVAAVTARIFVYNFPQSDWNLSPHYIMNPFTTARVIQEFCALCGCLSVLCVCAKNAFILWIKIYLNWEIMSIEREIETKSSVGFLLCLQQMKDRYSIKVQNGNKNKRSRLRMRKRAR